ncbi:hypothetical protein RMB03_20815 [Acinetobacter sp. V91_7]|uniref:LPO_1073/Vpar_1526 family protein n=1 Tax=unclassified Acinetobacter TaxID=196816 RepID=UPI00287F24A1|nr:MULTISPECIES: LPO_1073/Vpar_1526 family protein [unclassified Acinetobacter]MDS7933587.1 hypothetical protein [Acinetobacter sp. V91_4B]MDS7965391.1 hypothetical protein [Acinetobacter sp. V91_7]MDS8029220.1 hypothetical protein [Acinetobacter sp. V91_13]
MGDKVEQTAEAKDESTINQAGRDINNHYGPKMYEIIQTIDYQVSRQFEGLLHKHAPALIQNEMRKVEASVNNFKATMSSRLSEQFETLKSSLNEDLAGEKLIKGVADSNFQYLFQDSLEQVIRKKEQAPQEVLVELLINKITSDNDTDYLIEEAIEVLKSLNKNHVNFILLTGIIIHELSYNYERMDLTPELVSRYKMIALFQIKWILNYFLKLEPTSIDFEYLDYKGLIDKNKTYVKINSFVDSIVENFIPSNLKNELNIQNSEIIDIFIPELYLVLNGFGLEHPYKFKVLSKISNVIFEKYKGSLIMSIERFKELNKVEGNERNNLVTKELLTRGITNLY